MPPSGDRRQAGSQAKRRKLPDWIRWFMPFEGIRSDLAGRAPYYKDDWREGLNCGIRCASLPVAPANPMTSAAAYIS